LTIAIDALPPYITNEQPRITFVLHRNALQGNRYQRTSQELLSFQYGDAQANALNIPAYLFAAKSATSLPPNLQSLASLQVLTDPAVVLDICQKLCQSWRMHRDGR
jgi:hypothetical protein